MVRELFQEEGWGSSHKTKISQELDLGKLFSGSSTMGGASGAILMLGEDMWLQVIICLFQPASQIKGPWTTGPPKQHTDHRGMDLGPNYCYCCADLCGLWDQDVREPMTLVSIDLT